MQDIYLRKLGIAVHNAVETSDTSSIYDFVKNGLGIALAPKTMTYINSDFKNQAVDIEEAPIATIGLTWKKDHYMSDAGRAFFETTLNFFNNLTKD